MIAAISVGVFVRVVQTNRGLHGCQLPEANPRLGSAQTLRDGFGV